MKLMKPITLSSLTRCSSSASVSCPLEAGSFAGLQFNGTRPSADPWKLLAVAMNKLNKTTIAALVREASDVDTDDIKAEAAAAIEAISETTWRPCKGKVTHKLTFEEVDDVIPA